MATKRFVTKHGLDNNNQTITNVANPSTDTDAANKQWVTSQISNSGGGTVTSIGSTTLTTGGTSTVPTVNLTSGIVTAGTTGSASLIPVVTVDTYGRVTTITTAANPQGTVTSVTGTSPVVSSGGAAPVISMSAASSGVNGYMTGTYATKLDGIATGATDNTGTVTSITTTGANGVTISGGSTQTITTSGTFALALGAITPTSIVTGTGSFSGDVEFASSIKSPNASNSPITIAPDGTGDVHLNTDSVRIGDNNADATIATRGTGDLIITTHEGSANEGIVRLYDGVNGDITLTPNGSGQVKVGTDQVVTLVASQTLTNKTLTSPTFTAPALGTPASGTLTNCTFPTLNQNTTGSAGSVANTLTISSPLSGTSYNGSSAVSIGIPVATTSVNGYLSSTDWTTFNNKGSGTVTSVTGTSPVVSSGGATPAISIPVATTSVSGYLSSTDWTTFNNKTSNTGTVTSVSGAGTVSGLTLTGTVTGSGSITLGGTIATLNQNTTGSAGSVPASGLTGSTLASGVTASSLTSVGTLTGLSVSGANVLVSAGYGIAYTADQTRIMTPEDNVSGALIRWGSGGVCRFLNGSTESMRLTSTGLGIGTASPQSKFHIGGDGAQTITTPYDIAFNHYYSSWGANATRTWLKKSWNATYNDFTYLGVSGNAANTAFGALILSNAVPFAVGLGVEGGGVLSTEYLRVSTAGNLGVGTASPSQKLEVLGNALIGPTSGKMFIGDVGHGTSYPALAHQSYANTTGYALLVPDNGNLFLNKRDVASTVIGFRKNNVDMMVINNDGNVGIGTASPATRLHIEGASVSYGQVRLLNTSGSGETSVNIGRTGQTLEQRWTIGQGVAGIGDSFGFYTGGLARVVFTTSGNVGIGTASPSYNLDVTGTLRVTDRIHSNEWIQFTNATGLYSPTNGAHFLPNASSYGSWKVLGSRNGWCGLEFETSSNGNVSLMINQNGGTSGFHNNSVGWQMRWNAGTIYCNKGAHGAGTEATVLDSSNYTSYALPITGGTLTGQLRLFYGGSPELLFRHAAYPSIYGGRLQMLDYGDGMGINFDTSNNVDTWGTRMVVRHNGNVGIGTTTPSYKLDVSGTINGTEHYAGGWFRNSNSGQGLYNTATGNHFYSDGQYWNCAYSGTQGIRFRNGHAGGVLGYLYAETSAYFGLLNNSGNWAVMVIPSGGGINLYGTEVNVAQTLYVHEADNKKRVPRTFVQSGTPSGTITDGDVWLQY